jgi:Fur family ferric uptake transcriptional regulator
VRRSILFSADPLPESLSSSKSVAALIRRKKARATPARVRVLDLLQTSPSALTHAEIEVALGASALDRVTLYRVLEWLVDSGLAHRHSDAKRIFRFSAAVDSEHRTHIHFRCDHCGRVFCIDAAPPQVPTLPEGFSLSRMDFDLRGCCAQCERLRQ